MSSRGMSSAAASSSQCARRSRPRGVWPGRGESALGTSQAGSSVKMTDRSSSAAAAAMPPRTERGRPSVRVPRRSLRRDPAQPGARCQARRSGSWSGSVASASSRCGLAVFERRWPYAAERTSGWRNRTRTPMSTRPASIAGAASSGPVPSRPAACHKSGGSPVGSAAATGAAAVRSAKPASRRRKLSSIWLDISTSTRGRSRRPSRPASARLFHSASGSPRVPRRPARTRSSSGSAGPSSGRSRASPSCRPSTLFPAARRSHRSLTAREDHGTDSASSRRATNANACADSRSNHWASSTTHRRGASRTASDNRFNTPRPIRRRSGEVPEVRPKTVSRRRSGGPEGERADQAAKCTTGAGRRTGTRSPIRPRRRAQP